MASAENERLAKEAGVKHVALPHVGKAPPGRRAEEKGRRFREGYRFRAGIEGRIHALKRDYGLRRCRYRGERGFGPVGRLGDPGPQPGEGRGGGGRLTRGRRRSPSDPAASGRAETQDSPPQSLQFRTAELVLQFAVRNSLVFRSIVS